MSLCGAIPRVILAGLHSWTPRACFTFWKVPGTNKARVKSTFALCVCVCVSHCRVWLSATPWTVAHQAPPISQARIPEWGAISFSRASSQPRDQTQVTCTAGRFSTTELLGKPRLCLTILKAWLISSKPRPDDFIILDQTSFTIFHKIMPSHPQINLSMTSKLLYFVDTHHTHTHTHTHTQSHIHGISTTSLVSDTRSTAWRMAASYRSHFPTFSIHIMAVHQISITFPSSFTRLYLLTPQVKASSPDLLLFILMTKQWQEISKIISQWNRYQCNSHPCLLEGMWEACCTGRYGLDSCQVPLFT